METIEVNGIKYVRADQMPAEDKDGLPFVIVRSKDSGVHAGYEQRRDGNEIHLLRAIRIWYWDGASSLSQLAAEGTKKPEKCKFGVPVEITVMGCCERIVATEQARTSIEGVPSWRQ